MIVDEVEDGEVVESTTSEPAVYYDSSKSFFDSISCEANKLPSDRYAYILYNATAYLCQFLDGLLVMKKKLSILKRLATAIQEVQEIVAATKTTAAIKTKGTIIPEAIRVDAEVAGIDKADNIMPVEAATLVGEADHPRYVSLNLELNTHVCTCIFLLHNV